MDAYIFGEKYSTWCRVKEYILNLGYINIEEWLDENQNSKEYSAKLSLYKARLERIKELTEINV